MKFYIRIRTIYLLGASHTSRMIEVLKLCLRCFFS